MILMRKTYKGHVVSEDLSPFEIKDRMKSLAERDTEDLMHIARQWPNGDYIVEICKRCGFYITNPDARTANAIILDRCGRCFNLEI